MTYRELQAFLNGMVAGLVIAVFIIILAAIVML